MIMAMEIGNEFFVFLTGYLLVAVSDVTELSDSDKYSIGWGIVGVMICVVLFNMAFMIGQSAMTVGKYIKKII